MKVILTYLAMTTAISPDQLREQYLSVRAKEPARYFRTVAADLGVSEAELLVAVHSESLARLSLHDLPGLFGELAAIGTVRTMTRNDDAVIEQDGEYRNLHFTPRGMGQTVGDLDLRIFGWHWAYAYALADTTPRGIRRSVQFFDGSGTNIHKVFLEDAPAFEALVARWRMSAETPLLEGITPASSPAESPDDVIEVEGLHREWDALRDTHDFHALLQRFAVGRLQALRLAGPTRARRLETTALRAVLEGVSAAQERIMIFVGNRGLVQIFIGQVKRVVETPGWLNVLDPGFNLHVRQEGIASAWVVRKPTVDGIVSSLECYDAGGSLVLQLFGKRSEGEPSPAGWTRLLEQVEDACAA